MSYFVVERSGDGGELRIPLPTAYETREAAIRALSAATGSGSVTLTGEVFIADLGSAVPVLLMAAVAPAPAAEAPAEEQAAEVTVDESQAKVEEVAELEVAEAVEIDESLEAAEAEPGDFIIEEATAEPAVLDESATDEVYTSWAPIPDVTTGGAALASAIKRATTTLEDEGVVAPESVLAQVEADESPDEEASDSEGALVEAAADQGTDIETSPEWPWANIESYEVPAGDSEPTDEVLERDEDLVKTVTEPVGVAVFDQNIKDIVESLGGDAPIITSAPPEGEETYMPHPVILGDYADPSSEPVEIDAAGDAGLAEKEPDVRADADTQAAADASSAPLVSGYAPTGDLDLGEYTCQDCVYSNTCPKVGQVAPAECGSFQWKSE